MSDNTLDKLPGGFKGMSADMGSDQTAFKGVQWGKVMMWIFLLSDTFVLSVERRLKFFAFSPKLQIGVLVSVIYNILINYD